MKRLFRTNKPEVNPLPPPPTPLPDPGNGNVGANANGNGVPAPKRSMANFMGAKDEEHRSHHHSHSHSNHAFETRPRQGSVTPFPVDMGREPAPPSLSAQGQPGPRKKERVATAAPSLLEIQQMQAGGAQNPTDAWVATQRQSLGHAPATTLPATVMAPPPPRKAYDNAPSPEGWSVISGPTAHMPPSTSNASTPTVQQSNFYLPPGARPPSPQQNRPGTPTRPHYPSSLAHSQSSIATNGGIFATDMDPYTTTTTPRVGGRDRGYSSASGSMRGSDNESSAQGHAPAGIPSNKQKAVQPLASRSPLANTYHTADVPSNGPQYYPPPGTTPYAPIVEEIANIRINGPTPEVETRGEGAQKDKEKDKKKFWGMGMTWGNEKKDKHDKHDRPSKHAHHQSLATDPQQHGAPDYRRSADWAREDNMVLHSSQGHGTANGEDEAPRGRMLGLDLTGGWHRQHHKEVDATQVDSVTAAIQLLCAQPDPAFATIYEVCDRINHSSSPESVGKEAAHALRKTFKHGGENERAAAANLWLIMMRNVTAKGFRTQATSKKFLAALESILLAPSSKPLVSPKTHRLMTDILADITYNFGGEKGSEGLAELWRKVKMPQEPDMGVRLPEDFQAFVPENFYAPRPIGSIDSSAFSSPPSSIPNSRRPSSPNPNHLGVDGRTALPPLPHRGPSPLHMGGGPGYASLPSHGDDMRRLMEESTAAKESARVLAEALVYTRPNELDSKPVIKEFYRKCFLAHESLTGQIGWAQAEAEQSRERAVMAASMHGSDDAHEPTSEEEALGKLFEAHGALAEALKQHDDLERLARDEEEIRQIKERSKKDTRMDRNQQAGLMAPVADQGGSTSRSPSPGPYARLPNADPAVASPRNMDSTIPLPIPRPYSHDYSRSRTPSPDRYGQPRYPPSPGRAGSPLGLASKALGGTKGPRPLPNPFSKGQNTSQHSLGSSLPKDQSTHTHTNTSRSGTGSTNDHDTPDDNEELPIKPSRKALGKRRAIEDRDNHFDPDDMFGLPSKKASEEHSEESVTADEVFSAKPVTYAYDAYQEKLEEETRTQLEVLGRPAGVGGSGGSGGSGSNGTDIVTLKAVPV